MSILFQYTKRVLKANKGRTVITIAGIVLSFALFTAVLTAVSSLRYYSIKFIIAQMGDWHGVVYQCTDADEGLLKEQEEVTGYVSIENQGVAYLEGVLTEAKPYAYVGGVDEEFCDTMSIRLTAGRMPETAEELLVPEHVGDGGLFYWLGEEIVLQLGERFTDDGGHIQHQEEFYGEVSGGEHLEDTSERTFTVVGFYQEPGFEGGSAAYTFLTVKSGNGTEDIYFKTKNISEAESVLENAFSEHWCSTNITMMKYTGSMAEYEEEKRFLFGLASILCGVIAFVSVSLIYNAFSISVGERTKQFGLLKSIGATKKQIRMTVLMETALLCIISVPPGLLAGCLGLWGVLTLLQPAFRTIQSEGAAASVIDITFHAEPLYLGAAAAAGVLTVIIAAFIPAWRANRLSPIEGIRQTADVKARDMRRIHGGRLWGRLFGVAGTLAYKNAKRNKKPCRAIIFSMVTSLVLLLGGGGLVYYMQKMIATKVEAYLYDLKISYGRVLSEEENESVKMYLDGTVDAFCPVIEQNVLLECGSHDALAFGGRLYVEEMYGYDDIIMANVFYVEDDVYREYLEQTGFDLNIYLYPDKPKALVLNWIEGFIVEGEEGEKEALPFADKLFNASADLSLYALWAPERVENSIGYAHLDNIIYYYYNSEMEFEYEEDERIGIPMEEAQVLLGIEPGEMIERKDMPYWMDFPRRPAFFLPMSAYDPELEKDILAESETSIYLLADRPRAAETYISLMERDVSLPADYSYVNTRSEVNYEQAFSRIMQVFMMCFVVLLCLIAMANITNTVTTSVRLRTREYAMLKSIGISGGTMFRYVLLENLTYSVKALVTGCLLGLGINYLTFQVATRILVIEFSLPVSYYAAGIAGTVMIMFFAVFYMRSRTKKGNVCEELRNEVL